MDEDVEELEEKVETEVKSADRPKGVVGGVEGGVEGGEIGGVQGGIVGGVVGGQLGDGPKVFHHSELEAKRRPVPVYPSAARGLGLGEQRCKVRVFMDETGTPYKTSVSDCPNVFHQAAKDGIMKWRWYPPKSGKTKVKAQTLVVVKFREQ